MPADYLEQARQQSEEDAQAALKDFKETAACNGVNFESRMVQMAGGGAADPFIAQCRLSDLIVMGQYDPQRRDAIGEVLIEAALFDSGVPVMIVPYAGKSKFSAEHVMIAWDGSATAVHAIRLSLSLLQLADKISVVMVDRCQKQDGEPGAEVATYLSRHGFKVNVEMIASPDTSVSDALRNFVSDNGVDMVVMGGYGHSRMREFVLGGATYGMLKSMTVPMVMAH
ncbi:universal stress protein [Breoghania sp.]|uniref:universal stress protein n=1 Tax=Breoghania sp. TaxID=2065378 RepID=UPI00262BF41F|nr:universal stress protein [Breoghania sp.]MDJ0930098.1 universal stress protein [Breoghania sp.]